MKKICLENDSFNYYNLLYLWVDKNLHWSIRNELRYESFKDSEFFILRERIYSLIN